jgi:hypothetical protein
MKRTISAACAPPTACRSRTARTARPASARIPGKVFKGKKMAGHMGDDRVTTQNLDVVSTDADRGLILIKGAVPGSKGAGSGARRGQGALPDGPAAEPRARAAAPAETAAAPRRLRRAREPNDGSQGHHARRQGRRQARRSTTRSSASSRARTSAARGALAAGQAPRRARHKVQGPRRGLAHRRQDVQAEGHRPRPSPFGPRSAVPRRRQGARPGRARATRTTCPRRCARSA